MQSQLVFCRITKLRVTKSPQSIEYRIMKLTIRRDKPNVYMGVQNIRDKKANSKAKQRK